MLRAAVILVIVATLVGALMPAQRPRPDAASAKPETLLVSHETSASGQSGATGEVMAAQLSGGEVRLTRRNDGHFYATVEINGIPVEFLIDTGATGIVLTEADARRASIPLAGERRYVGEGAGGALQGEFVSLGRVQLGDELATDMKAVVIDGGPTNLLGQTFLSRFSEVNVRGDTMTLR